MLPNTEVYRVAGRHGSANIFEVLGLLWSLKGCAASKSSLPLRWGCVNNPWQWLCKYNMWVMSRNSHNGPSLQPSCWALSHVCNIQISMYGLLIKRKSRIQCRWGPMRLNLDSGMGLHCLGRPMYFTDYCFNVAWWRIFLIFQAQGRPALIILTIIRFIAKQAVFRRDLHPASLLCGQDLFSEEVSRSTRSRECRCQR